MDNDELHELSRHLARQTERYNNTGIDELQGLTPAQLHQLLYHTFEDGSVVQW